MVNVSPRSLRDAIKVSVKGTKALIKAVEDGKIAVLAMTSVQPRDVSIAAFRSANTR